MRQDYETEAIKLAKAIDIAIDSFNKYPPKDSKKENLDHIISVYYEWKDSILNPEPKYKKIASLKYSVQDVFTYFQEALGETVEYFWRQIAKENLGYIREDKLRKILIRGKIKGRIEYELAIDSVVVAEQDGRITEQESKQLSKIIEEFEAREKKTK